MSFSNKQLMQDKMNERNPKENNISTNISTNILAYTILITFASVTLFTFWYNSILWTVVRFFMFCFLSVISYFFILWAFYWVFGKEKLKLKPFLREMFGLDFWG